MHLKGSPHANFYVKLYFVMQNLLKIAGNSSFRGKKIEFHGKKSSFPIFGQNEFPSKRTKKPACPKSWDLFFRTCVNSTPLLVFASVCKNYHQFDPGSQGEGRLVPEHWEYKEIIVLSSWTPLQQCVQNLLLWTCMD